MERKQKKRTFSYEPFIAGAILKFGSIDNVDFSMLAEDFEKKINVEFSGEWYAPPHKLRKYYNTKKNGTIALRDGISLDEYLQEEKCVTYQKTREVA